MTHNYETMFLKMIYLERTVTFIKLLKTEEKEMEAILEALENDFFGSSF
jgi:hypothetical protein